MLGLISCFLHPMPYPDCNAYSIHSQICVKRAARATYFHTKHSTKLLDLIFFVCNAKLFMDALLWVNVSFGVGD